MDAQNRLSLQCILAWGRESAWLPYFCALLFAMLCRLPGSFHSEGGLNVGKITLPRGMTLLENDYVSSCVPMDVSQRDGASCIPMYLTLQPQGNLVLFRGEETPSISSIGSERTSPANNALQIWESGRQKMAQVTRNDVLLVSSLFKCSVSGSAELRVFRGSEVVWSMSFDEIVRDQLLAPVLTVTNL